MQNEPIEFSDDEIKQIVLAATLMSSIDREVHSSEWNLISAFSQKHWKGKEGDLQDFLQTVLIECQSLLANEGKLNKKVEELILNFNTLYSSEKKNAVIDFLSNIIEADGYLNPDESNLFAIFLDRLS